jgi:hypothetical protein
MARPIRGYRTASGIRVPGVTTVIKSLDEGEGLIHWAWKLGIDGVDYRAARDSAAAAGTLAHDMIEAEITGLAMPSDDDEEKLARASNALERFRDWRKQTRAEIEVHERPLVSERHLFGGTPDATATIDGKRVLLDWKSSNSVRGPYIAQLGGYAILLEEVEGWVPAEAHLLRFDKTCESWTHHYWGPKQLQLGRDAFLAALSLFPYRDALKKAV